MKTQEPAFNLGTVYDNIVVMLANSPESDSVHPLLTDRERLDRILDVMYAKIQKTLFPGNPRRRLRTETGRHSDAGDSEQILEGSAVSADDVLNEALWALVEYPPERLKGTWEGLAVRIAGNKAIDALRTSKKGLRGTDHRTELRLVSGDFQRRGPDGELEPSLFEVLASNRGDPEAENFVLQDVTKLRDLVREILDERGQEVFFAIHFLGHGRKEVGERLGLTSQRISQIYDAALRTLEVHPDYPFSPQ